MNCKDLHTEFWPKSLCCWLIKIAKYRMRTRSHSKRATLILKLANKFIRIKYWKVKIRILHLFVPDVLAFITNTRTCLSIINAFNVKLLFAANVFSKRVLSLKRHLSWETFKGSCNKRLMTLKGSTRRSNLQWEWRGPMGLRT